MHSRVHGVHQQCCGCVLRALDRIRTCDNLPPEGSALSAELRGPERADDRDRTGDDLLGKQELCHLSYVREHPLPVMVCGWVVLAEGEGPDPQPGMSRSIRFPTGDGTPVRSTLQVCTVAVPGAEWTQQDLNLRQLACETSALPG